MSDCCYSEVISIQRPVCVTPTPTPTSTATPTPTPTSTPTPTPTMPDNGNCCFCESQNIADGTFVFNGINPIYEDPNQDQGWSYVATTCGLTESILLSGGTTVVCNGTTYNVSWVYSGVGTSTGTPKYDATIVPV